MANEFNDTNINDHLNIGTDDVIRGLLYLFAQATGSIEGGLIRIYNAVDHDTNVEYWRLVSRSGDFIIADDGQTIIRINEADSTIDLLKDVSALSGSFVAGVTGTTRGVINATRGAGGNTPGVLVSEDIDGVTHYIWSSVMGIVRHSTSIPTSDTDGEPIGESHTAQSAFLNDSTASTVTIAGAGTWVPFNGMEAGQTEMGGNRITVTVGADDYIEIAANSDGEYRVHIETNCEPASGTNKDVRIGMSINGVDPIIKNRTGKRTLSNGAVAYWGRTFDVSLSSGDKLRLEYVNDTDTNDVSVWFASMSLLFLGD